MSDGNRNLQRYRYILNRVKKLDQINNNIIRSNIDYMTTAFKRDNKIVLKTEMSYRAYPQDGKFQPIEHDFSRDTGEILYMQIVPENGEAYDVPKDKLNLEKKKRHHNETVYTNVFQIPDKYNNQEYITLKITVEEMGYDHWAYLTWMSLYPTEIISYRVICQNNLIIKEHMIFDNQKELYHVKKAKDDHGNITEYAISCDQWTDPYTGFSLVIAEP